MGGVVPAALVRVPGPCRAGQPVSGDMGEERSHVKVMAWLFQARGTAGGLTRGPDRR